MKKKIDNMWLNYTINGSGRKVILLHGWNGSIESLAKLSEILSKRYQVLNMDIPGFGNSSMPPKNGWNSSDYAKFLYKAFSKLDFLNATLIGHSNGGRIAIKYSLIYKNQSELILIDSAGIKNKLSLKKKAIRKIVQIGKPVVEKANLEFLNAGLRKSIYVFLRESDYINSGDLKNTFIKLHEEDLSDELPKIKKKTLILWGRKDSYTPLWMGEKMNELIPNSSFKVFNDYGHGLPLYKPDLVADEIFKFMK